MPDQVPALPVQQRQWFIAERWQEYDGERRANLLRLIGIAAFYLIELANYHGFELGWLQIERSVDLKVHQTITLLAVTWTMVALGAEFCLRQRIFPSQLKFATTAADIVLLTLILMVAAGPRSPLVVGYFLVIVLSTLRFSLPLIWCSTGGALAGYLFLLGYAKWYVPDRDLTVPRYQQLIVLVALTLTGIILGQVVRCVRALAEDYAGRLSAHRSVNAPDKVVPDQAATALAGPQP